MLPRLEMGFVHCLFRTIASLKALDDDNMPPLKFFHLWGCNPMVCLHAIYSREQFAKSAG